MKGLEGHTWTDQSGEGKAPIAHNVPRLPMP
jgi:hypothetical protein